MNFLSDWECKKRWKPPTDRELKLRAKINSGWSVHTANLFLKPEIVKVDELQIIQAVIQRSKDLEKMEVERIGRMLCKLENMTRNALGDGKKTCSMCGISFGLFKSSPVHCVDCGKAVCEKCRVDTLTASQNICLLCKICSENREVWKKSGGWFYGKFPTMAEEYQEKCVIQTSGSPKFDTWSHRAPDIVRLQSFEPPEENHNDNSQYITWTITSAAEKTAEEIPLKNLVASDDTLTDSIPLRKDSIGSSIPDLHFLKDRNTTTFVDIEPQPKISLEQKGLHFDFLTVGKAKLSASCPSLADHQEPSKLRRKPSIRRKRSSAPVQEKSRNK